MKPVASAPTISMTRGKAWRFDLPAMRARVNLNPNDDGGVDAWLVEAAWAHLAWHSYVIALIHLRPLPEREPPLMYLPNGTHELLVLALHPDGDRDRLLAEGPGPWCMYLEPPNFAAQLVEVEDDLARARVRHAVELICAGNLSPDTDFHHQWVAMFGDNMMRKR